MGDRGLLDLAIARLPGLSFRERISLCGALAAEGDLARGSRRDMEAILGRGLSAAWDVDLVRMLAERDAEAARLRGIGWVSWAGLDYPPLLREIYDPPAVLFFRGRLPDPERPLAAVVGTRKPSPQAAAQAYDVARGLGPGGVSVVSGLALGVDAMAHRGSVEGGAPAFAVLGSGVDEVYPASNRPLARRVLESGGALLSELPPGAGPRKWNFPARNRIISGLCRGVLVVEAPEKSGALITARFALEQNRELWVASAGAADGGSPFDRRGTIRLAEDGAEVVGSASRILEMWGMGPQGRRPLELEPVAAPVTASAASGAAAGAGAATSLARSLGITI